MGAKNKIKIKSFKQKINNASERNWFSCTYILPLIPSNSLIFCTWITWTEEIKA